MELFAGLLIVLVMGLSLGIGLLVVALVWKDRLKERGLSWEDGERVARKDRPDRDDPDERNW